MLLILSRVPGWPLGPVDALGLALLEPFLHKKERLAHAVQVEKWLESGPLTLAPALRKAPSDLSPPLDPELCLSLRKREKDKKILKKCI